MLTFAVAIAFFAQDVDSLIRDLASDDADKVKKARRALVDLGAPALEPLKVALSDAAGRHADAVRFAQKTLEIRLKLTQEVTFAYLWIEEKIAEKPEAALPELLSRMLAERERREFGPADFKGPAEMALDADPSAGEARVAIIKAVQQMKLLELAPRLTAYLKDPADNVREYAAYVLVECRSEEAGKRTMALLDTQGLSIETQITALRVLTHLRHKGAGPLFLKLLDDAHPAMRARAVVGIGALRMTEASEKLVARLSDPDPQVREAAAATLVEFKATELVPKIIPLLDKSQPPAVRNVALKTLVYLGDRRASGPIADLLSDSDKGLRLGALVGLGRLADPSTVGPLLKLLKEDPELREPAAEALGRMESSDFVPELIPLVRHKDPNVRSTILALLRTRDVSPVLDLLKGAQAPEAATLLGLDTFRESRKRLVRFSETLTEAQRPLALMALAELGEETVRKSASALAADAGPLQHDLLFALNGLEAPRVYRHLAGAGIKEFSLKGTVAEVVKQLAAILEVEMVVSDRCAKDALEVPIEIAGIMTAREAFAKISRLGKVGFLVDGSLIRTVPVEEALRHWVP